MPILAAVPSLREQGVLGWSAGNSPRALLGGGYPEGCSQVLYVLISAAVTALPWETWVESRAWRWGTGIQMGQEGLGRLVAPGLSKARCLFGR